MEESLPAEDSNVRSHRIRLAARDIVNVDAESASVWFFSAQTARRGKKRLAFEEMK